MTVTCNKKDKKSRTLRNVIKNICYLALAVKIDANNVLVNDTTGANVEVAHFGIAHQTGRQTNGEARGVQSEILTFILGKSVHDGRFSIGNCIALHLVRHTPAIDYNQTDRVRGLGI